jgi:hypothetical protein
MVYRWLLFLAALSHDRMQVDTTIGPRLNDDVIWSWLLLLDAFVVHPSSLEGWWSSGHWTSGIWWLAAIDDDDDDEITTATMTIFGRLDRRLWI